MLLLIAALASTTVAPPDLVKAVADWDAAQVRGDASAIERLLADDYVLVSGSGALETKTQFKAELTDPAYKPDPFTVEQPVVRLWPGGAVYGGVVQARGVDHGQRFDARIRFADVWAKRAGSWHLIYTHVSRPK